MNSSLLESTRITGIIVLIIGVVDSAFVHGQSSTLDGHTIVMAGIGLIALHGGAAAKKAVSKADTAADKAAITAAKTEEIDTKVSHLTNGYLRRTIEEAIKEGHEQGIANAKALEAIHKTLAEMQGSSPKKGVY